MSISARPKWDPLKYHKIFITAVVIGSWCRARQMSLWCVWNFNEGVRTSFGNRGGYRFPCWAQSQSYDLKKSTQRSWKTGDVYTNQKPQQCLGGLIPAVCCHSRRFFPDHNPQCCSVYLTSVCLLDPLWPASEQHLSRCWSAWIVGGRATGGNVLVVNIKPFTPLHRRITFRAIRECRNHILSIYSEVCKSKHWPRRAGLDSGTWAAVCDPGEVPCNKALKGSLWCTNDMWHRLYGLWKSPFLEKQICLWNERTVNT